VITTELDAPAPIAADPDDDGIRDPDPKTSVGIRFLPGKPLSSYVSTATHLARYYQRLQEWEGTGLPDVTIIYNRSQPVTLGSLVKIIHLESTLFGEATCRNPRQERT
jgi:hypothetical protein